MAGFLDVLLRGVILVLTSVALGGVVWSRRILGGEPHAKPDAPVALALRVTAVAALGAAAAQVVVATIALVELAEPGAGVPVAAFLETTFAHAALARVTLAVALAVVAQRLARDAAGASAWWGVSGLAVALVAGSAVVSHAVARVEQRGVLLALDAAHQLAAAVWVGSLAHLTVYAVWRRRRGDNGPRPEADIVRRFSAHALGAVAVLTLAGLGLTWLYVGEPSALIGTAYGVMVLSKVALFVVVLALAYVNFRAVRAAAAPDARLVRFVEVELGLAITVLFAAASLTSLPPAVDVTADRATVAEVAARFRPAVPSIASPDIDELLRAADPLMARQGERKAIEMQWSEYNHHWAGVFVTAMGILAILERLGVRAGRHWPLVLLGLAGFLFVRNDPRAWPLGPAGFWESFSLPDVLQHRVFVVLIVVFAVFEWAVRTGRLAPQPWGQVFPLLCAIGGGLLLTHSHAMFNLKAEFLTEVTHAPLGILGAFAGWARWLEVRLPGAGAAPGWLWRACITAVGVLLLVYREG